MLIIDHIERPGPEITIYAFKKIMKTLSLVCRFFRAVCQPRMFETIVLCEDSQTQDIRHVKMRRRWCRLLASGDQESNALANLVRSCTLAACDSVPALYRRAVKLHDSFKPLLTAIPSFRSLESFTLRSFHLSVPLFETLTKLPNLTSVTICDCPAALDQLDSFSPTETCNWSSLSVEHCDIEPFVPIVSQLVSRSDLRRLVTDNPQLLDAILENDQIFAIEELHITVPPQHPFLIRHLERCPSVTSLVLQCPFCEPLTLGPFMDTVLPCLRSIASYPDTIRQFLGPRPITKVTILDFPSRVADVITPLVIPIFELLPTLKTKVLELSLPLRVIRKPEIEAPLALPDVPKLTLVWYNFEIAQLLSWFIVSGISLQRSAYLVSAILRSAASSERLSAGDCRTSMHCTRLRYQRRYGVISVHIFTSFHH